MEVLKSASPMPSPKKDVPVGMDFSEAINKILADKRVTRLEWNDKNIYCFLKAEVLHIRTDKEHQWMISSGDLMGTDWVVVE